MLVAAQNVVARKLKELQGNIKMMGQDIFQTLFCLQSQMQIVSQQIKRSSNVGIGFAFSCAKLKEELENS